MFGLAPLRRLALPVGMLEREGGRGLAREEEEERGGRKEEGKEGKAGSGAEPRRFFLKTRFYPLSGPRWGLSFAFLHSSHRGLPFGETPSPRGRLDAEIERSGQSRLGRPPVGASSFSMINFSSMSIAFC